LVNNLAVWFVEVEEEEDNGEEEEEEEKFLIHIGN